MNFQVLKRIMIATKQSAQMILEVERQYLEAQKKLKDMENELSEMIEDATDKE